MKFAKIIRHWVLIVLVILFLNTKIATASSLIIEGGNIDFTTNTPAMEESEGQYFNIALRLGVKRRGLQISYFKESGDFQNNNSFSSHEELSLISFVTKSRDGGYLTNFGVGLNVGKIFVDSKEEKIGGGLLEFGVLAPIYRSNFTLQLRGRISYYANTEDSELQRFQNLLALTGKVGVFYELGLLDIGVSYYAKGLTFSSDEENALTENTSTGAIITTILVF